MDHFVYYITKISVVTNEERFGVESFKSKLEKMVDIWELIYNVRRHGVQIHKLRDAYACRAGTAACVLWVQDL